MRRFWAWFSEDVVMPRGWLYLALGWAFLSVFQLIVDLIWL